MSTVTHKLIGNSYFMKIFGKIHWSVTELNDIKFELTTEKAGSDASRLFWKFQVLAGIGNKAGNMQLHLIGLDGWT